MDISYQDTDKDTTFWNHIFLFFEYFSVQLKEAIVENVLTLKKKIVQTGTAPLPQRCFIVPFSITSPFLLPAFIPSWKQINNSPFLWFGYFKMLSNENICSSFLWLAFQHNSLDFIQTTGWINTSSLFTAEYYSMIHMFHGLFNHLSVEGHLSCFQFPVIMNKTAINTRIQICMWTQVFISLDKCPGVQ